MARISIVGGGIAGLALAAILDPDRFDVTLYEQQPGRYGLATALAMWPGAQRALLRAGADGVLSGSVGVTGSLLTMQGRVLLSASTEATRLVARRDLVAELERAVPASVSRITARLEDPSRLSADLVVGADGVHSVVRQSTWGQQSVWGRSPASLATPYLAVRGLVSDSTPGIVGPVFGEYWGGGRLFGITAVPGGFVNWFCAFRSELGPRSVGVEESLSEARRQFGEAAPAIKAVLAAANTDTTLAQRIWIAPPLRSYCRGRVVLIGDAAHAMTPNLGRGACESLIDADVLGSDLNRYGVEVALRRYDVRRVARTQAARVASEAMMRLALSTRLARPREVALYGLGTLVGGKRAAKS